MKKFTTILFMFCALSLFAQSPADSVPQKTKKLNIQFEAGVNNFQYYGHWFWNIVDVSVSHYEAVSIEKELNPTFSLSFGIRNINYGIKSTGWNLTDLNGNVIANNVVHKFNYWTIQTPLQFKMKLLKSKKLAINFGGYLGFNYYNSASSSNSLVQVNPNKDKNTTDKGLIVGLDYTWIKRGNFKLGNSISYYRGFNNIAPNSTYVTRRTQGLTIGFTGKFAF